MLQLFEGIIVGLSEIHGIKTKKSCGNRMFLTDSRRTQDCLLSLMNNPFQKIPIDEAGGRYEVQTHRLVLLTSLRVCFWLRVRVCEF